MRLITPDRRAQFFAETGINPEAVRSHGADGRKFDSHEHTPLAPGWIVQEPEFVACDDSPLLPPGFVLVLALTGHEPVADFFGNEYDSPLVNHFYPSHYLQPEPNALVEQIYGEVIDCATQRVIARCHAEIYPFTEFVDCFSSEELWSQFDGYSRERGDVYRAVERGAETEHLLYDPDTDLLHINMIGVEKRYRKRGLGAAMLYALTTYGGWVRGCAHTILKPYPLVYEDGVAENMPHEGRAGGAFERARKRLVEYYRARFDFTLQEIMEVDEDEDEEGGDPYMYAYDDPEEWLDGDQVDAARERQRLIAHAMRRSGHRCISQDGLRSEGIDILEETIRLMPAHPAAYLDLISAAEMQTELSLRAVRKRVRTLSARALCNCFGVSFDKAEGRFVIPPGTDSDRKVIAYLLAKRAGIVEQRHNEQKMVPVAARLHHKYFTPVKATRLDSQSLAALSLAVELDPSLIDAQILLARVRALPGTPDALASARRTFSEAIKANPIGEEQYAPQVAMLYGASGWLEYEAGAPPAPALKLLRRSAQLGEDPELYWRLAQVALSAGLWIEALGALKCAVASRRCIFNSYQERVRLMEAEAAQDRFCDWLDRLIKECETSPATEMLAARVVATVQPVTDLFADAAAVFARENARLKKTGKQQWAESITAARAELADFMSESAQPAGK